MVINIVWYNVIPLEDDRYGLYCSSSKMYGGSSNIKKGSMAVGYNEEVCFGAGYQIIILCYGVVILQKIACNLLSSIF